MCRAKIGNAKKASQHCHNVGGCIVRACACQLVPVPAVPACNPILACTYRTAGYDVGCYFVIFTLLSVRGLLARDYCCG